MCGIAGIIGFGEDARREEVERMAAAIAHRGPDGQGVWTQGRVGFGHRRLAIIDLSAGGAQPMVSKDAHYAVTFNGEIYNYQDERRALEQEGEHFASTSDTEVLLALWRKHGEACLHKLRGMFAFAAADMQKKEAILVRDRLGKKPLYYFVNDRRIAFASEMKALRTLPDCPREIDAEAIRHFLVLGYLPAPYTGIKGIYKLPAAHLLRVRWDGQPRTELLQYWSLPTDTLDIGYDEAKRMTEEKLSEAVRMRLVADVPLGAFLSGGLDSSTVVALMRRHSNNVHTFSIGFRGLRSEIPDAERVAKHLGVQATTAVLEPDVLGILPTLVRTYDEPFGDPSCIPTYFLAKHTRQHVTVALSGDGGDENFGGYARYPYLRFSHAMARLPCPMLDCIRGMARWHHLLRKNTVSYRSLVFMDSLHQPSPIRSLAYMGNCTEDELRKLCRPPLQHAAPTYALIEERIRPVLAGKEHDALNAAMRMDILTQLADQYLPKVDLAAMAHGLEVRCPFLDHELVELCARLPSAWKIRGKDTKRMLKDIVRPLLPPETLQKRKQGFRLPMDEWFRGPERERTRARVLEGNDAIWSFLDRKGVEDFWNEYQSSRIDYSSQIFLLAWLQEWIEAR